ncbi:hypothetical protein [Mycoplasmopsis meleagridis]|uniref:hypothetical protein n=1 Tax=Mycoplasmopsis meleagridis TaxID=29561 RepID=UPI00073D8D2B|nr:hypothetical protein [Mycoplasmopsis meleagridis]KUH47646.1 hypothetical protein ASB56_00740 [Mycoplasmopsis meleagridis]
MDKRLTYSNFKIQYINSISGDDLKNLRKFYSPLLSSDAILLYEHLRDVSIETNKDDFYFDFNNLVFLLNIKLENLNKARRCLESLSLLSTYQDNFRQITVFELEKPLNSIQFSKNKDLCKQLVKKIGNNMFNKLINKTKNIIDTGELSDISASFEDIFNDENTSEEEMNNFYEELVVSKNIDDNVLINNLYEATLKETPATYYYHLTNIKPTYFFINVFNKYKELGLINPIINLTLYYLSDMYLKIDCDIFNDTLNKIYNSKIDNFEKAEQFLDQIYVDTMGKTFIKKTLWKAAYTNQINNKKDIQHY